MSSHASCTALTRAIGCRATLDEVIAKLTSFPEAVAAGKIKLSGNPMKLAERMGLMDEFPRMFEIVEPKRAEVG
ncbi:alkyl sulfatase BDS1-like metallo-beta-lactamase superfamily hydrolase [Bradyrhizobium sp. USDA 377]